MSNKLIEINGIYMYDFTKRVSDTETLALSVRDTRLEIPTHVYLSEHSGDIEWFHTSFYSGM